MFWKNIGLIDWLVSPIDVRHTAYSLSNNWSTAMPGVAQFFYIVMLVVVVALLAYYTTRLIGTAKFGRGGRRNLEIVESMGVGPQSFVHVLRVGEQFLLIGVTRGQVSLLTQLEADKLKIPESGQMPGFETLFNRFQKKDESSQSKKQ